MVHAVRIDRTVPFVAIGGKQLALPIPKTGRITIDIATATITPPARKNIAIGDAAYLRSWFLGRIANIDEVRSAYKAVENGAISLGRIMLNEAIV